MYLCSKTRIFLSLSLVFALASGCSQTSQDQTRARMKEESSDHTTTEWKGWDYLVKRLRKDGIPEADLKAVYQNRSMPEFYQVPFTLQPKESHVMYTGFTKSKVVQEGKDFVRANRSLLLKAERQYGVNYGVIVGILLVESGFGKNMGKEMIVNKLSRIANIRDAQNLTFNLKKLRKEDPSVTFEQVEKRARYLEETFYPEVLNLFRIAKLKKMDLLAIQGSSSGAFGMPQFLPSSYVNYGVDGNGDGVVSLFQTEDAVFSVGHYLQANGWQEKSSMVEKRKALFTYNKSEPYVSTILKLSTLVK